MKMKHVFEPASRCQFLAHSQKESYEIALSNLGTPFFCYSLYNHCSTAQHFLVKFYIGHFHYRPMSYFDFDDNLGIIKYTSQKDFYFCAFSSVAR